MSTQITPTSELEAVNECLNNIGQSPVSSISGSLGVDAEVALKFVRSVSRELQSKGWHWNTEENYVLSPDVDENIILPTNTLSVDTMGVDKDKDYVGRGRKLYDRTNHSYSFSSPATLELIVGLPFEELPETARRYVSLRAARLFQNRIEGRADTEDNADENTAWSDLHRDQMKSEDNNMLTGNYSSARTLLRHSFPH